MLFDNENERGRMLSLSDLLVLLRRWWWLFLPPMLLSVAVVGILTATATPLYRAEAEVVIRTAESANLFPLSDVPSLLRSPSAEEGFISSTEFEQRASAAAGTGASVETDVGDVNSRIEPSFISFRAIADEPQKAADTAQSWAETYISMRHEHDVDEVAQTIGTLEGSLAELTAERGELTASLQPIDRRLSLTNDSTEISQLTTQRLILLQSLEPQVAPIDAQMAVINSEVAELGLIQQFLVDEDFNAQMNRVAEVPDGPFAPSLARNLVLGLVAAILLGLASVLAAESFDDRVRSSAELSSSSGLTCLTTVPLQVEDGAGLAIPDGNVAESFQRLVSALDFAALENNAKVLAFTSARSSESKTTTVARLGVTLARQGRRTLIIGADLRRPTLAQRFDCQHGPGLADILAGVRTFEQTVANISEIAALDVLRAGAVPEGRSPAELLRSPRMGLLIDKLRNEYDHILIDCPPVLPVVDALDVAKISDGIVFNAFASKTRRAHVNRALAMVRQATTTTVFGFVMTGTTRRVEGYGDIDDYYGTPSSRRPATRPTIPVREADLVISTVQPTPPAIPVPAAPDVDPRPASGSRHPEPVTIHRWEPAERPAETTAEPRPMSIDEIDFIQGPAEPAHDRLARATDVRATPTHKGGMMKKAIAMIMGFVLLLASPLGAQSYEGTSLQDGIFYLPAELGPGSEISFAITGLMPNSDVTFTLLDSAQNEIDGLQVAGAVVMQADGAGNFNGDLRLPASIAAGSYVLRVDVIRADGSPYQTSLAVQVSDSGSSGVNPQPGTLALTGNDSRSTALNGILLVALGIGLVVVATRRRRADAEV